MMNKYKIFICTIFLISLIGCSEDTLEPVYTGAISGKVVDKESGEPLSGAKITTNPASTTIFSDSLGNFMMYNILVDDYSVQAEKEGYTTGFESTAVVQDVVTQVSFELVVSTNSNPSPLEPKLVFPEDGSNDLPLEVIFIWESSGSNSDDLTYTLDLRNGATDEIQIFEVGQDTTYTVPNLQLATKYFWQVSVADDSNDPVRSTISEFKTLTFPDNPYLFVKKMNDNLVIFSGGNDTITGGNSSPDNNVLQLTSENLNSFKPRKGNVLNRIAFLRNSGGATQIYTMNYDGTDVRRVTNQIPLAGFRIDQMNFTWARNDSKLYYPHFNKLYSINPDGTGNRLEYTTRDGAFISEVAIPEFDEDIVLLKTNNSNGYNIRIYTARLSNGNEESVILENVEGAAGGIDISANASKALYFWDTSESQNSAYKIFESRIFIKTIGNQDPATMLATDVLPGENELDGRFSPSEGGAIFTRVKSNTNAIPDIYSMTFDENQDDTLLFTDSFMPDWE